MTSIEKTAYPRFKRSYTPNELKTIYTPTTEEKLFATEHTKNQNNYFASVANSLDASELKDINV